jgi:predicted MFS family arabinose efflux permease
VGRQFADSSQAPPSGRAVASPGEEVLAVSDVGEGRRQRLLWVLSAATFLIFFQAFMVAPLLPRLAELFGVPVGTMGLIVPAYLIPYGAATLAYGPLSDRFGRGRIILASLLAFVVLTALTAAASRRRACSCSAS